MRKVSREYLTVEFAGICMLVKNKGDNHAKVWLIDVWNALSTGDDGHSKHSATLLVHTNEPQPEADFVVAVPGDRNYREYAGWNLAGKDVRLDTDLTGQHRTLQIKRPHMLDLAKLCFSGKTPALNTTPHLSSTVTIPAGTISAITPKASWPKLRFAAEEARSPIAPAQFAAKFRLRLPFRQQALVSIGEQTLRFTRSSTLLIGNLCQEIGAHKRHFYAYYSALHVPNVFRLEPTAKPPKGGRGEFGEWPWLCIISVFIEE